MKDGTEFEWELADPCKVLSVLVSESPALAETYLNAVRRSRPSHTNPWHLVVGLDEFTPGNKLRVDQTRNSWVLRPCFGP